MKNQGIWAAFFALLLMIVGPAVAQPGINELKQASGTIGGWYFNLSDLVLVTGAISGMIGGLRVFTAWQTGRHHIDAQIIGWLFGCIFLSLLGGALKLLFGI